LRLGNPRLAWIVVTGGVSIIATAILFNTFKNTRERVTAAERSQEKIPIGKSFRIMLGNPYFLICAGMMIFFTMYQIIISTDLAYYCQYILGDVNLVLPLSTAEKLPMIPVILLLPLFSKRFGKRTQIATGCVIGILGQIVFIMQPQSHTFAIISAGMRGIGMAPFYGFQYSLPSDAIEYGQWKTGTRVEALMFSSMQFGQKMIVGIISAVIGAVLAISGFDGMKAVQSAEAVKAVSSMFLYAPLAVWSAMLIVILCYRLDKKYGAMMTDLAEREKAASAG
jgi:GPH family glycoside/pentoside/hexuronide:cation symporter